MISPVYCDFLTGIHLDEQYLFLPVNSFLQFRHVLIFLVRDKLVTLAAQEWLQ